MLLCTGRELQQQVAQLQSEYTRVGDQLESEQTRIMQVRHLQVASKCLAPEQPHPVPVQDFTLEPSARHAVWSSSGGVNKKSGAG